jgi:hypothetical protein
MGAAPGKVGIHPNVANELNVRDKAMSGDIVMVISPPTCGQAARSTAWSRTVTVSFKTAAGELHDWLTQTFATKVSASDTSTAGTATVGSTSLTVVNGVATVTVSGGAVNWLNTETDTATIAACTVLGVSVTGGTSVQTWTA